MKRATKTHQRAPARKRIAYFRGMLLQKRHLLESRLASVLKNVDDPTERVTADIWDIVASDLEREKNRLAGSMESEAVAQIDHALERLRNRTYGVCETCGKPIPKARLQALPYATMCVLCKEADERRKALRDMEAGIWDGSPTAAVEEDAGLKEAVQALRARRAEL